MEGVLQVPRTVEEVFRDFRGRRAGMIKALTTEFEKFYQQCHPDKENLSLYALPNGTWEVKPPAEEVPTVIPEPTLGINFARDGMQDKEWLSLVAAHSDAWLLAVAFYFSARFGFDKSKRRRLFQMINDQPTLFEIVAGVVEKPTRQSESQTKVLKMLPPLKDEDASREDKDKEQGATLCGACGDNSADDEFWIFCDVCERWFHGKCVKITPSMAEHIKRYECPACSSKRPRA